jgi:lipoprotein signal peptidase
VSAIAAFLKPTGTKLVFLLEWASFVVFSAARSHLGTSRQLLVAAYPLVFFYLVGCALAAWSRRTGRIAGGRGLLGLGALLVGLDQAIKTLVTVCVPYGASLPIAHGWLQLAHVHNTHGSWLASEFQVHSVSALQRMQWGLAIPVLLLVILCHRYYVRAHRRSLWIDVAFLGVFSTTAGWMCDMALRGYIVDFIGLPGLVTADFKDIYGTIGVAALLAETLDYPQLWWRWRG